MPDKISVTRLEPDAVLVGADVGRRQTATGAIEAFAKTAGYNIVAEFHDAADPVAEREGFAAVLERIAGNGVRTIIVKSRIASREISPCGSPATISSSRST